MRTQQEAEILSYIEKNPMSTTSHVKSYMRCEVESCLSALLYRGEIDCFEFLKVRYYTAPIKKSR